MLPNDMLLNGAHRTAAGVNCRQYRCHKKLLLFTKKSILKQSLKQFMVLLFVYQPVNKQCCPFN